MKEGTDTTGATEITLDLDIGYTDGDGDLGFFPGNTDSPYFNIYVDYYEKLNGQFRKVKNITPDIGDTINFHGRLPLINNENPVPLKGTITYSIPMQSGPKYSNTFKMKVWLLDRALHKSNTIETPEIIYIP